MHIYLITNLINGKQYVGAEKGNDPGYFGSGRLIIEAIERFDKENFKKKTLVDDKYIDSWDECLKLEKACILSLNTLVPNGYNITLWNWPVPVGMLRKGGRITGKKSKELGVGIYAPENLGKGGKISGKRNKELKRGIFAPGMQSKGGKIVSKKNVEGKRGLFDPIYNERRSEWRSKGNKMRAYTLFEIDGLIHQMTLGTLFKT